MAILVLWRNPATYQEDVCRLMEFEPMDCSTEVSTGEAKYSEVVHAGANFFVSCARGPAKTLSKRYREKRLQKKRSGLEQIMFQRRKTLQQGL